MTRDDATRRGGWPPPRIGLASDDTDRAVLPVPARQRRPGRSRCRHVVAVTALALVVGLLVGAVSYWLSGSTDHPDTGLVTVIVHPPGRASTRTWHFLLADTTAVTLPVPASAHPARPDHVVVRGARDQVRLAGAHDQVIASAPMDTVMVSGPAERDTAGAVEDGAAAAPCPGHALTGGGSGTSQHRRPNRRVRLSAAAATGTRAARR